MLVKTRVYTPIEFIRKVRHASTIGAIISCCVYPGLRPRLYSPSLYHARLSFVYVGVTRRYPVAPCQPPSIRRLAALPTTWECRK